VRREIDARDARIVHLYPTERAREGLRHLRDTWSRTLEGIVDDPETIDSVNATLRRIENELTARRWRADVMRFVIGVTSSPFGSHDQRAPSSSSPWTRSSGASGRHPATIFAGGGRCWVRTLRLN
jgi:hypothetical protein